MSMKDIIDLQSDNEENGEIDPDNPDDGRVHRSVGALLANIGTKDGFKPKTPPPLPEPDIQKYEKKKERQMKAWAETRMYDAEFDKEWMKEEQYRVDDLYFGHFIKVQYTSQNAIGYYCELCLSEMNGEASLESHTAGMKHLKKKDMHEKNKKEKDMPQGFRPKIDKNNYNNEKKSKWPSKDDRKEGYGGRGMPGPPPIGAPPPPTFHGGFGGERDRFESARGGGWGSRNEKPAYDSRMGPPPPLVDPYVRYGLSTLMPPKNSLAGGPTGALIQKLADCSVNNDSDADLAINVVSSLVRSLQDYNTKKGELKVADLYMDAELKLRTIKAVSVGQKMSAGMRGSIGGSSLGRSLQGSQIQSHAGFSYTPSLAPRAPLPPAFPGYASSSVYGKSFSFN